ncbi:MAG TPA: transaldolase [Marmoricola sp.]|nr:transaldolase [Marmoricola sp.]HNI70860.1 transaldolase [Marmoricola sp.]HNJ77971.1 transaldolase [Marmoricola sp.]
MTNHLKELTDAGVSIWLDDLSRDRIESGNLADLIKHSEVVGVTTNPSIFSAALAQGDRYDAQVRELLGNNADSDQIILELTTTDVRNACDLMAETFVKSRHKDGRVSIEVPPDLANDVDGTVKMTKHLVSMVDRDNVMIKIPATPAGCAAITKCIAQGIDINVTLIFGLDQYREVLDAYLTGLEQAADAGFDLSTIQSVASLFVSRVDTEIDQRLGNNPKWSRLHGRAGIANARLTYQIFEEVLRSPRWLALAERGANVQRPLWASTGVKNPDYPDTMYVIDLVVEDTINTMPEKTLDAVRDHGVVLGDQVRPNYENAKQTLAELEQAGIDYADVIDTLLNEGLAKFDLAWDEVHNRVADSIDRVRGQ